MNSLMRSRRVCCVVWHVGVLLGVGELWDAADAGNVGNTYIGPGSGSLRVAGNWSEGVMPTVGHDAIFAGGTGIRTVNAADLQMGSLNVTAASGTYSIRNDTSTATVSHLTLGGAGSLGNGVTGVGGDLLHAAAGSTLNLIGVNGGQGGTGWLEVILGQSGDFNIAGTATVSCGIGDGGSGYGLNKTGAGKLTLSGSNTYTGNSVLTAGSLVLGSSGSMRFVVGDQSHTTFSGQGSVTLEGQFVIDSSGLGTGVASGSWTLVDVGALTVVFAPGFRIAGDAWLETDQVWRRAEGLRVWRFSEVSGELTLETLSGYAGWISNRYQLSGARAAFDFDDDRDGIANGLEWILGGDPTCSDRAAIEPKCVGDAIDGLTMEFGRMAEASVPGVVLELEWGGDPGGMDHRAVIGNVSQEPDGNMPGVAIDSPVAGKITVRLPAAHAVSGRLFARLKATKN